VGEEATPEAEETARYHSADACVINFKSSLQNITKEGKLPWLGI